MTQNAFSAVTRVRPEQLATLTGVLDNIGKDPANNPTVNLGKFQSLHFCCWVLQDRDPKFAPTLVLESNFDGELEAHLDEWIQHAHAGLHAIYSLCEGYPSDGAANPKSLKDYLRRQGIQTAAFYVGCYGQPLNGVRNAMALRERIETFLDAQQSAGGLKGLTAAEIRSRIQREIQANPVQPACGPIPTHDSIVAQSRRNTILWALLGLVLLLPLLPFLVIFMIVVRMAEKRDLAGPQPVPPSVDPRLFFAEDLTTQNHLTTLVNVKPGKFRVMTLKGVLWLIQKLAPTVFIAGNLGGIPTIHFARWLMIDNDQRLLFFSNYDGSWASYLGDFVDKANYGLTAVWSNTESFPPSRWLFLDGARHIEAFKLWSRQHNLYANVWYSAYPDATVSNITSAVRLRDGLNGTMSEADAEKWLQLL